MIHIRSNLIGVLLSLLIVLVVRWMLLAVSFRQAELCAKPTVVTKTVAVKRAVK